MAADRPEPTEEASDLQVGSIVEPSCKYVARLDSVDAHVDSAVVIANCVFVPHPPEPVDEPRERWPEGWAAPPPAPRGEINWTGSVGRVTGRVSI